MHHHHQMIEQAHKEAEKSCRKKPSVRYAYLESSHCFPMILGAINDMIELLRYGSHSIRYRGLRRKLALKWFNQLDFLNFESIYLLGPAEHQSLLRAFFGQCRRYQNAGGLR
jgi:hypothetical protein